MLSCFAGLAIDRSSPLVHEEAVGGGGDDAAAQGALLQVVLGLTPAAQHMAAGDQHDDLSVLERRLGCYPATSDPTGSRKVQGPPL